MVDETKLALIEQDIAYMKKEMQGIRDLRETVASLKQTVELLYQTVWGILACLGGGIVIVVLNIIFKGAM